MNDQTLTEEQRKLAEFTMKLSGAITDAIKDEESEFHIDREDVENYTTLLAYAITATVPHMLANAITGEKRDLLDVNHLANRLIVQFRDLHPD